MIAGNVVPLEAEKSLQAFSTIDSFIAGSIPAPAFLEKFLKDYLGAAKSEQKADNHPLRRNWGAALERDSQYAYQSRNRLKKMSVQGLYCAHFYLAASSWDSQAEPTPEA